MCVCVCVYVCVRAYVCVRMNECWYVILYVNEHTHKQRQMYVYLHVCM